MEKIEFSVLMSVYYKENAEYLKISLDSIINQTLKPNEIILVEDGILTPNLYEIIEKYKLNYSFLKVIQLEKNVGLGMALNEGLKHCTCEYVARMDSDDCSVKDRFEKQINVLINNPQIDVIGSNICEYDEMMLKKTSERKVPENDIEIKKYLKKRNPFNHMTVIYKKKKVLDAGNYLDCPFFEDYYLWCRMASNNCNFYNIQENLVKVRTGLYMIEKRGGKKYKKCILNFQKKIKNLGIISNSQYWVNIMVRTTVASMPKKVRLYFYKSKLRKK